MRARARRLPLSPLLFVGVALLAAGCAVAWALQAAHATATAAAGRGSPPYRFIYNSDSAPATVLANGWNLVDVGSQWSADQLPAGAKGLVWAGDYDNGTCSWQV